MKKRTLNEYRQTKEYQGSSEGRKYLDDLETPKEIKEIQKEITLNEQIEDIAERVKNRIHDVLFNEIFEIMDYYDELNWGHFVQDDAPEALLDACMDHKQGIHYEIYQLVLKKLK